MLVHVVIEALTRHPLHDVAGQRRAVVRIGRGGTGREHALGHPLFEQRLESRRLGILGHDALRLLFETRDVLHEIAHRDGLALARRNLEVEVLIDVRVEIDLPLLDLLHHGGPRHELRHRSRSEQCQLRIDRRTFGDVRVSIAPLGQDLSILDHGDDCAGDVARVQRIRQVAVEPGIDITAGQSGRCGLTRTALGSRRHRRQRHQGRRQHSHRVHRSSRLRWARSYR